MKAQSGIVQDVVDQVVDPTSRSLSTDTTNTNKEGGGKTKELTVHIDASIRPVTTFTKEIVARAHLQGIKPHELLYTIAMDSDFIFSDVLIERGKAIPITRPATPQERMDCAKAVLPYYAAKKVEIEHRGEIKILHALARSPLADAVSDENFIEGELEDNE